MLIGFFKKERKGWLYRCSLHNNEKETNSYSGEEKFVDPTCGWTMPCLTCWSLDIFPGMGTGAGTGVGAGVETWAGTGVAMGAGIGALGVVIGANVGAIVGVGVLSDSLSPVFPFSLSCWTLLSTVICPCSACAGPSSFLGGSGSWRIHSRTGLFGGISGSILL